MNVPSPAEPNAPSAPRITPRLVLASRSPRRAALLRDAGYRFEVEPSPYEDPDQPDPMQDASRLVEGLALDKALPVAQRKRDELSSAGRPWIILGADTVCENPDGRLIGKPQDDEEARAMLEALVGSHQIVKTGVALIVVGRPTENDDGSNAEQATGRASELGQMTSWVSATTVRFEFPPDGLIDRYVSAAHWRGKAGGYNLTELQAAGWKIHVEGEPSTVVGLPMPPLRRELERLGLVSERTGLDV